MINITSRGNNSAYTFGQFTQTNPNSAIAQFGVQRNPNSAIAQFGVQRNPNSAIAQFGVQRNPNSANAQFGNFTKARDIVRKVQAPDMSFAAFLKEKGYKDYVRTGFFGRKRAKSIARASAKEKREYESWKADKQLKYNRKVKEAAENNVQSSGGSQSFGLESANIQIKSTPSQRELNNKKRLEQIERIEAVDLSLDLGNYIGDKTLEKRYPGLVQSIADQIVSYGNTFREDEEYSEVVVTNTINNALEVADHINWLITPPNSINDVELRSVDEMGRWVLQTTESVGLGIKSDGTLNLDLKEVEKPKEVPQKILPSKISSPIIEIKKDAKIIEKTKLLPFDVRSGIGGFGLFNISERFGRTSPNQLFDNSGGFRIKQPQRIK